MAQANRIQIEKPDLERGVLFGRSKPFGTGAFIFVSEKHDMQVWYEHDGDCGACDRYHPIYRIPLGFRHPSWDQD